MTTTLAWLSLMLSPITFCNLWRKLIRPVRYLCKNWYAQKKKKIVSTKTDLCHFFQFDSIDVTKISSHHGVRSDLFKRPLDKTRITDFFGGVAQVEVVDQPADSIPTALVMEDSPPLIEIPEQQKPRINILLPPSSSRMATAISGLFTWLGDWRLERTWASVGFIGVLVGWVVFKRWFRPVLFRNDWLVKTLDCQLSLLDFILYNSFYYVFDYRTFRDWLRRPLLSINEIDGLSPLLSPTDEHEYYV